MMKKYNEQDYMYQFTIKHMVEINFIILLHILNL